MDLLGLISKNSGFSPHFPYNEHMQRLSMIALVAANGTCIALAQSPVLFHSAPIAPSAVVSDSSHFDRSGNAAVVSLNSGANHNHWRMNVRDGNMISMGQTDKYAINSDGYGRTFFATRDGAPGIGTIEAWSPQSGLTLWEIPSGGTFLDFVPWSYNKTLFSQNFGPIVAPSGNNVYHSEASALITPFPGGAMIRPRAQSEYFWRPFATVTTGGSLASPVCEIIMASGTSTTYSVIPSFTDVFDMSTSGFSVLGRTGPASYAIYSWATSGSVSLNVSGLSNPYFTGISQDGSMAFGGNATSALSEPSTGFFWTADGNRADATSYLFNVYSITGLNVRCVLDVSLDRKKILLITSTPSGGRQITIVKLPRPLFSPIARYETDGYPPILGDTAVFPLDVTTTGLICGFSTISSGDRRAFTQSEYSGLLLTSFASDSIARCVDIAGQAYGNGPGFTQAAHFSGSVFPTPIGTPGTLRTVNAASSNGLLLAGVADQAGNNYASLWRMPSAALERPFGTTVASIAGGISENGVYIAGTSGNMPKLVSRTASNTFVNWPLSTTFATTGGVYDVRRNGSNSSYYLGGYETGTPGDIAGAPVIWKFDVGSGLSYRYSAGFGTNNFSTGVQGGNGTGSVLPAGTASFNRFGIWSKEYGEVPLAAMTQDYSRTRMATNTNVNSRGFVCGYSGVDGYLAFPIVPISVKINLQGWSAPFHRRWIVNARTRPFASQGEAYGVTATPGVLSPEGFFTTITNSTGVLDFQVKHPHSLRAEQWDVFVSPITGVPELEFNLINGDVNDDNEIGPTDLQIVLDTFGTSSGYPTLTYPDLDGDGEVGPGDLQIVLDNFGLQGVE
jgi:hypothetical protein